MACESQWLKIREGSWRAAIATEAMIAAYAKGSGRLSTEKLLLKARILAMREWTDRDSNHIAFTNIGVLVGHQIFIVAS